MQEILKSEAAYFATPVGVAYLVDKYAIPEGTIKEMVSQVLGSLEPVVGDTDLSGVVVQAKKDDDDEVIDVTEEELEMMPRTDVSTGGDDPDPEKDPKDQIPSAEEVAKKLAEEGTQKIINETIKKLEKKIQSIGGREKTSPK